MDIPLRLFRFASGYLVNPVDNEAHITTYHLAACGPALAAGIGIVLRPQRDAAVGGRGGHP